LECVAALDRIKEGLCVGVGDEVWPTVGIVDGSFPQLGGGDREGNSVGICVHWAVPMASMDRARVGAFIVMMICCRGWVVSAFYDTKMSPHLVSAFVQKMTAIPEFV